MKVISLLSIIIVLAVAFFGFFYWHKDDFSKQVVKLEILAPDSVKFGDEVAYTVKILNQGDINLEDAKLTFQFATDSLPSDGGSQRREVKLKTIYPGQEQTISFKARIFGAENDKKVARAALDYRPKDLSSSYESSTSKTIIISAVPFNFDIDIPSKIASGRKVNFRLNYFSAADYPLSNLKILIDYPSDFEFLSAVPFSAEKNEWKVNLLNKGDGGRISITGIFGGKAGEDKIIRARAGIWLNGKFILLKQAVKGITIVSPQMFISQKINGDDNYIASPGDLLHYQISFKNLGDAPLSNLFLLVKLSGQAFDLSSVKSLNGAFKSGDNSIIFDGSKVTDLNFLSSQAEGQIEFWVKLKNGWPISGNQGANQLVKDTIFLAQSKEEFAVKINSQLALLQKAYYQDEVFGNSGPLPPKVGQPTTFTVTWQAKNYYNDITDATIKAKLPDQVSLTGKIFPQDSKLTFDSKSREIVWNIGDMAAGAGVNTPAPNVSFQISLKPEMSQKGQFAPLVSKAVLSANDKWTGAQISASAGAISTVLPDDKTAAGKGTVE